MKIKLLLVLFVVPMTVYSQSNPFDSIKYDQVIAYEFQGRGGRMIEYCLESDVSKISKSIVLKDNQVKSIENVLTADSSYGNTTMACFDPHLGIVYYYQGKVVGSIDICLECNYLIASEDIQATTEKIIVVSDEYSYPAKGFAKSARKQIYEFCKILEFEKFLKPLNSIFD